jgi:hypothetical protein
MVARIGRQPVFKHALEATLGEVGLRHPLWHIRQAQSGQCRVQYLRSLIENKLAVDTNLQLAAAFLELPGVKATTCRQAQIDAVVADQVLWLLWYRSILEIRRGSDDSHTHVRRNANGDHATRHLLAAPNAGVEALSDDVGQPLVDGDLDFDIGILPQKLGKLGYEDGLCRVFGG